MQLTASELTILDSLSPEDQYYIRLRLSKRFDEMDRNELTRACLDVITRFHFDISAKTTEAQILQAQTLLLIDELRGDAKKLTLPELKEIFRLGAREEYGQFFGACGKTYHQFIKAWLSNPKRQVALNNFYEAVNGRKAIAEKPGFTDEDFFRWCENSYQKFLKRGEVPETLFVSYDYIKKYTGKETLMLKEDWTKIRDIAIKAYKEKIKNSSIREQAMKWKLCITEGHKDFNKLLSWCVKDAAVKVYFERLKAKGLGSIREDIN